MRNENVLEHWRKSIPLMWDVERVVDSLDRKFRSAGVRRILDCACGTGVFAVGLARKGYSVDCSDASREMVSVTQKEAKKNSLLLKPKIVRWSELSANFSGNYDLVMMRGNSVPYVISWENQNGNFELDVEKADKELVNSFREIHAQLRPKGIFYFDMRHIHEKEGRELVGEGVIDGKQASLTFDVSYHRGFLRRIRSKLKAGNKTETRVYNSYHLPFLKLDDLLQEAGFRLENIRHCVTINGENMYAPYFVAKEDKK